MAGKIMEIGAAEYEREVLDSNRAVVDFYSTECPPFEALASKYESLSEIYGDDIKFIKIFRQGNRELAESLGVSSSPTILFYKNGQLTGERLSGGIKRSELMKNLDALAPEKAEKLKAGIRPVETECDVLILGGGPAGLAAAIYSAQAKLATILVDTSLPGGHDSPGFQLPGFR